MWIIYPAKNSYSLQLLVWINRWMLFHIKCRKIFLNLVRESPNLSIKMPLFCPKIVPKNALIFHERWVESLHNTPRPWIGEAQQFFDFQTLKSLFLYALWRLKSVEVTNHLFETEKGHGSDLIALNINRARDHGVPPYMEYRKMCGLATSNTFFWIKGP
jgi:hypothetical protein